jgi:uncharacterized protein YtpQ (UPF0354 family)
MEHTNYTVNKRLDKIYRVYYAHECLVGMKEKTQYIFRNSKIPIPLPRATFSSSEQPHHAPVNF